MRTRPITPRVLLLLAAIALASCTSGTAPEVCRWKYTAFVFKDTTLVDRGVAIQVSVLRPIDSVRVCAPAETPWWRG